MPDYRFYQKENQIVALEKSDEDEASRLCEMGYKKQFEEINAGNGKLALQRLADIRREDAINHRNFLAGAGNVPLIGAMTAIADFVVRKIRR